MISATTLCLIGLAFGQNSQASQLPSLLVTAPDSDTANSWIKSIESAERAAKFASDHHLELKELDGVHVYFDVGRLGIADRRNQLRALSFVSNLPVGPQKVDWDRLDGAERRGILSLRSNAGTSRLFEGMGEESGFQFLVVPVSTIRFQVGDQTIQERFEPYSPADLPETKALPVSNSRELSVSSQGTMNVRIAPPAGVAFCWNSNFKEPAMRQKVVAMAHQWVEAEWSNLDSMLRSAWKSATDRLWGKEWRPSLASRFNSLPASLRESLSEAAKAQLRIPDSDLDSTMSGGRITGYRVAIAIGFRYRDSNGVPRLDFAVISPP